METVKNLLSESIDVQQSVQNGDTCIDKMYAELLAKYNMLKDVVAQLQEEEKQLIVRLKEENEELRRQLEFEKYRSQSSDQDREYFKEEREKLIIENGALKDEILKRDRNIEQVLFKSYRHNRLYY